MTPERWQRIDEILSQAREQPAGNRSTFLDGACPDDPTLRREVETLLAFDERPAFIDQPAFNVHGDDPDVGRRIGPYQILRLLGRGGMGAVYLAARQDDYRRQVAIKVVKRGMDSDEIVRRFENERQILADLDHPHVARLLDGGTTAGGRPYFVMEYVDGEPIDRYCDHRRLSTRERLRLFRQVCSAVHLSHQSLVVHRDLKPGNILVTGDGEAKLLDFGLAKLLEPELAARTLATMPGHRPMTLKYASPEQVRGDLVTTASDTYSLGVLLYRLLTGHHPTDLEDLDSHSTQEILRRICEHEPRKPSTAVRSHKQIRDGEGTVRLTPESVSRTRDGDPRKLRRRLAGDLDAIVLKALRKEPQARYGSVEQFSEDVRRHLDGLPVAARKGTFTYRAGKFVRRNRWGLAVLLLILGFSVATTVLWLEARRERQRAVEERAQAVQERQRADKAFEFLVDLFETTDPDQAQGEVLTAREILGRGQRELAEVLKDDPRLWTELVDTLGRIYRNLGLYDEAREVTEESLRHLRQHTPGDDPEVAKRIANLAGLRYAEGNYGAAERFFREALEMLRRLGLEDSENVNYVNNLATILAHRGELAEAEELYRWGLEIREAVDGPAHPRVATSLRSLGNVLYLGGDFEGAEPLLRRALMIRRGFYGPQDTKVAAVLDKLGSVLAARGGDEEAEACFNEALAIRLERLGEDHGDVARSRKNLAALLLTRGDLAAGEELLDRALATLRQVKRSGDWEIADAESLLGAYLLRRGRYQEAEPYLIASYPTIKEIRGEQAIYTRVALRRILELYEAWGKPEKLASYRALAARPQSMK